MKLSRVILGTLAVPCTSRLFLPRQNTTLQPWQLTRLTTHSPSGRPGNDPHSILNATIYDPNTIPAAQSPTGEAVFPPSTANCSAQWLTSSDVPYKTPLNCTPIDYGYWTMTMLPGTGDGFGATEDFGLKFELVYHVIVVAQDVTKAFVGSEQFQVGENLSGECGGSGVCNWALKETPYGIRQVATG